MIDFPFKYQACFFADLKDIVPSAETIPPLLKDFQDKGLLPNTYHEIGLHPQSAAPQVRFKLSSSNNEWAIEFESNRINILKQTVTPLGENLGTVEDFVKDATDFIERILSRFPKKGTRLSLVINGFMDEMTEEKLNDIYPRIFVPLNLYTEHPPAAWNTRSISRIPSDIKGNEELVNIIAQVNRVQGQFNIESGISPYDRIQIILDINTYQGNTDPRFEMSEVKAFFPNAVEKMEDILAMLEERING